MSTTLPYYRFYLLNDHDDYYYLDVSDNSVHSQSQPSEVACSIGWDTTQIKYTRSTSFLGVLRALTNPYKFCLDAGTILRTINAQQGVEGICILKIDIINHAGGTWEYIEFAKFGLNFRTYEDGEFVNEDTRTTTVSISAGEDGVYQYLNANRNISYEIKIDDIDCTKVNVGGVKLQGIYKYAPITGSQVTGVSDSYIMIPNVFYSNEGAYEIDTTNFQKQAILNTALFSMPFTQTENFSAEALIDQDITFYIRQEIQIINGSSSNRNIDFFAVRLLVCDPPPTIGSNAAITQDVIVYSRLFNGVGGNPPAITPGNNLTFLFEQTYNTPISITKGQRVYVIFQPGYNIAPPSPSIDCTVLWFGNGSTSQDYHHDITPAFIRPDSQTKGYRPHQLLNKLVNLVTDNNYNGVSNYLSNPTINNIDLKPYNLIITCGDALRQLFGAKIKTTLDDFFKNMNTMFSMGLFVDANNNIRIEPLSVIFDKNSQIADLGVANCNITHLEDLSFNDIKIGYPNVSYDEINGRNEYNAGQEYKLALSRFPNGEDAISAYRADCYGVEYTRANIINKKTIDTSSDNDVFLIDTADTAVSGVYPLNRPIGSTITGLPYPTTNYNLSCTPKRDLLRNKAFLASILYANPGNGKLKFQTGDKNVSLVSNLGSGTITENADVLVATLGAALFQPFFFTIRTQVPLNIQALLKANPNGYFSFTMAQTGAQLKGFLWEVAITPGKNPVYDWILLGHPDNDMTKTIF